MALAKYIGITLKTAWALLHKIRAPWANARVSTVSAEAFFGGKAAGKRGRSRENNTEVAIALQFDSDDHSQFLKMQVIADAKGSTLLAFKRQYHRGQHNP